MEIKIMLEVGMKAPQFTLPDKNGNNISLSDFIGKRVVLYFYPKDNTPGCTRQACAFALKNSQIENLAKSKSSLQKRPSCCVSDADFLFHMEAWRLAWQG